METQGDQRPWYKKKRYIAPLVLVSLLFFSNSGSTTQVPVASPAIQTASVVESVPSQKVVSPLPTQTNTLSNDNYYTNTYGNKVHSPAYSNSIPAGASAQCRDGTYSFSQSRRGTCSHHGGVAEWL